MRHWNRSHVAFSLQGSCLKLICPAAKFPRNGSCQRRFSTIYGLVVRVTYRLHTNWNKTKYGAKDATDYNDVDLGVAIRKSIDQALEFKQCDRCSEMFYKSNTGMIIGNTRLSHYFDFKPMLYTKKTCHEGVIVDAMSRLDGEEVIVNLNDGEYVTFDIEEIEDVSEEEANTSYVHLPPSIHETLSCLQSYTMKYRELSQCPMVKLDDTLYSSLLSQAHSVGKTSLVKSLSGMNGGPERLSNQLDTMSVCWQEYRKTVSLVTNASMISTGDSIMSTGALVTLTIFIW